MKVKMLEWYQDASMALQPGMEVEVDNKLGAWLLEHRKAEEVKATKAEPKTPEEFMTAEVVENVTNVVTEVAEEPVTDESGIEQPEPKPKSKRSRK